MVTGAGRNIGRACVLELASAGFNVVINGSKESTIIVPAKNETN